MSEVVDAIVLSGSGYAGAEVLRLLSGHPGFSVVAATGHRAAGTSIGALHPHLAQHYPGEFLRVDQLAPLLDGSGPVAVFGCGAHGASAADTAQVLELATSMGRLARAVDLSADFRHDASTFEALYGLSLIHI